MGDGRGEQEQKKIPIGKRVEDIIPTQMRGIDPVSHAHSLAKDIPQAIVKVEHLIVSPAPMQRMQLGDVDSMCRMINDRPDQVDAVFWCEEEISLVMSGGGMSVTFRPEWHPAVHMFFEREGRKRSSYDDSGATVWEGEYAPVQMNKTTLIRYLKTYAEYFPDDMIASIKETRVTERFDEKEISLDELDEDQVHREEELVRESNLPPEFTATMPLFEHFHTDLQFEARLVKEKDRYTGARKGNFKIQVRLLNGREAVRGVMLDVLERVPEDIPRYYGRYSLEVGKSR